ncbi:MAG: hypothetical protein ACLQVD_08480 [Capsulimonadaceae bacterium]
MRPRGEGDALEGQGAGALDGEGDGAAFAADDALDDDGGGDQEDGRAGVDGVAGDGHLKDVDLVLEGGEEDRLAGAGRRVGTGGR